MVGLEEDSIIWFCDNKQIFYGKVQKANEGYKIMEMIGKEFEKRISAAWWVGETLHCMNKPGEFISFDPKSLLTTDVKLESGNFSTITTFAECSFVRGEVAMDCIVTADQYYRIRVFNKDNLHELHSTLSYKKNYVDKICQVSDNEIICFYDDGSVQLLGPDQLFDSDNSAPAVWLKHPFIGQVYLMPIDIKEDKTFLLLEKDACRVSFARVNTVKSEIDIIRVKKLEPGFAYKLLKLEDEIYTVKFSEQNIASVEKVDLIG